MNIQLNDKIHAAFEPIKEAVETRGEYSGAVLAVTYGTTRNESQAWFEEAGNLCVWRALSNRPAQYLIDRTDSVLFEPYRQMFIDKEIVAAILRLCGEAGFAIHQSQIGNGKACDWLMEQHKMSIETVVKTQMAMNLNQAMQQAAQAQLMAEQLSKGKLIGGPFGKGNGGMGRG